MHDAAAGADDDAVHQGVIDVAEAVRIAAFEEREDLLHQQATVDASLAVGEHGAVSVVVGLEETADRCLGDDRVEGRELARDLVEELGVLRHDARLFAQAALAAKQVVAQVDLEVVEAEHAHVAGEPIHADAGATLRGHQVEQVVGVVEGTLAVDRHLGPELVGDLEQRALEVGRELAGVAARRAACHPVTLDQDHSARCRTEREECRRDTGDPGSDDRDVGGCVGVKRSRWTVGGELGDPR